LIAECFFLWDNPIIRDMFFGPETLGNVTVEPVANVDPDDVIELYAQGPQHVSQFTADAELISDVLQFSGTRVRVARDDEGTPVGFSMVLPVCQESIAFLERHPLHGILVKAYFVPAKRDGIAVGVQEATAHYILPVVAANAAKGAVRCALFRDLAGIFGLS